MSVTLDPLVMDLVAFVAAEPRPYDEVIDAWRTSCPRLTVWEDAIDRGAGRPSAGRGQGRCWSSPPPLGCDICATMDGRPGWT